MIVMMEKNQQEKRKYKLYILLLFKKKVRSFFRWDWTYSGDLLTWAASWVFFLFVGANGEGLGEEEVNEWRLKCADELRWPLFRQEEERRFSERNACGAHWLSLGCEGVTWGHFWVFSSGRATCRTQSCANWTAS